MKPHEPCPHCGRAVPPAIAALINESQAMAIADAIKSVSHGEEQPMGLEAIGMAISGPGEPGMNNVVDALNSIARSLSEIASRL